MNGKRITFWIIFVAILGLIIWGLIAAGKKADQPITTDLPAPISATDHVKGSESAPITFIEYGDFQCPACGGYFPLVERYVDEASSTVRFVFRHFPLGGHKNAMPAAMAAEAAGAQGKFWEMYEMLFENQSDWDDAPIAENLFKQYALDIGLNASQFATDIGSSTLRDKIRAQQNEAMHIGVNGTPTFYVNNQKVNLPGTYDAFKQAIQNSVATSTP